MKTMKHRPTLKKFVIKVISHTKYLTLTYCNGFIQFILFNLKENFWFEFRNTNF